MTQCATVTALPTGPRTPKSKCHGADTDTWFPPEPQAERPNERANYVRDARKLCQGCPLIAECLQRELGVAVRTGSTHGIFGGTAPWERKSMLRNAQRRAHYQAVAS